MLSFFAQWHPPDILRIYLFFAVVIGLAYLAIVIPALIQILARRMPTDARIFWVIVSLFFPLMGPILWWMIGAEQYPIMPPRSRRGL